MIHEPKSRDWAPRQSLRRVVESEDEDEHKHDHFDAVDDRGSKRRVGSVAPQYPRKRSRLNVSSSSSS